MGNLRGCSALGSVVISPPEETRQAANNSKNEGWVESLGSAAIELSVGRESRVVPF